MRRRTDFFNRIMKLESQNQTPARTKKGLPPNYDRNDMGYGQNSIMYAISICDDIDLEYVNAWIWHDPECVNDKFANNYVPLEKAVMCGKVNTTNLLLANGAKITKNVLRYAAGCLAKYGHSVCLSLLKTLIAHGTGNDSTANAEALCEALKQDIKFDEKLVTQKKEVISFLLNLPIDWKFRDIADYNLLLIAAVYFMPAYEDILNEYRKTFPESGSQVEKCKIEKVSSDLEVVSPLDEDGEPTVEFAFYKP